MTRLYKVIAALAVPIVSIAVSSADRLAAQTPPASVGIYGAYQLVTHKASFTGVPNVPCCAPSFDGGSGGGVLVGAVYKLPFSKMIALQLRAGFSTMAGTMKTRENIGNRVENGQVVDVFSDHTFEPSLALIAVQPTLSWSPFSFPLSIDLGVEGGFAIKGDYDQRETLVGSGEFTTGGNVRNDTTGTLENTNKVQLAIVPGLSYDIPIAKNFVLSPEVSYRFALTDVMKDVDWKAHALRLGVSLRFNLGKPQERGTQGLFATVNAIGLDNGVESPIVQIRVEEFLATELRPLLNYVFFDKGSASLPDRYDRMGPAERATFKEDDLHAHSTLGIYHQMLNIIGKRLQQNPKARIKIIGCTSGEQGEKGNLELATRRSEMIRDFFSDTWQIDPSRMSIQPRGMPERASSEVDPDGAAENRRVEIVADTWAITEPVHTADTARAVSPSRVRFTTEAGADAGLSTWRLDAAQSGLALKKFDGRSSPPETVEWDLQGEPKTIPLGSGQMDYSLTVTDNAGHTYMTPVASIPVDQVTLQRKRFERIADKEINRYSLILFDYGSAELDESNRRIVDQIRGRIKPNADVRITGYTDRIGDEAINSALSAARAREAQQALGVKTTKVSGEGEAPELHDNNLPEGRFYCRTVQIVAETPITNE